MSKNPYTVVRNVLGWVGTILGLLIFFGLLGIAGFSVWSASGGWGPFFLNVLIFIGILGAFGGIIALLSWLGGVIKDWWNEREESYANKKIRKAYDAGTPLLDPEPILWGGTYGQRLRYTPEDARSSWMEFKPREFYEQAEEKYK